MKSNSSQRTGELIRQLRVNKNLPLRKIAARLDVDTSLLSKIERSEKKATKEQIHKLEEIFQVGKDYLMVPYLSEKIYKELSEEDCANEVLKVAEALVKFEKDKNRK